MAKGRLECTHCGQTFIAEDGQVVKIDHFKTCPGRGGGEPADD